MSAIDPLTPIIVTIAFAVFALSYLLSKFKLPSVITYIIAGVILGPSVFGIITDSSMISTLGSLGVVLLLFFIGMEVSLKELVANWRVAVVGTLLQVILSVISILSLGYFFDWPIGRSVLIGFVISLSSTAVLLKILNATGELSSKVGKNVLSILLVQDVFIIPMIIILGILGGEGASFKEISLQIIGSIVLVGLVILYTVKPNIKIPFLKDAKNDHELQIFMALMLCFGMAMFSGYFGLSTALGAFVAGIILSSTKEVKWVHDSLNSFYVVFVALFFLSVGLLIDVNFLIENWKILLFLLMFTLVLNIAIMFFVFMFLKEKWRDSLYSAVLLSQIGEFSFVLASVGIANGSISIYGYNMVISLISVSLLVSPLIIIIARKICYSPKLTLGK